MSAPVTVNGASVRPLTRLPPAESPDADAYRALHAAGAHFLLCTGDKRPIVKEWQNHPADLPAVLAHARGTGLIGVLPSSIGAVVVDLDPEGAADTTPPLAGVVVQHATRRKGTHFWYRAPDGEVRNRKWARTAGGQHVGDVRGSRGFVILWNPGAVAAAVIGDDFAMADPVDVSTLPWPRKGKGSDVEQMLAAKNGERNDTHNRLAFARARRGENQATLRTAAIASGLTVAEVSATIRSAEEGAERNPKPAGREWPLLVAPKEQPLAECFDAALHMLGVKVRRNLRSGANEVHGVASTEPLDPDGWAPLTDDGAAALFAKIEGSVGTPAYISCTAETLAGGRQGHPRRPGEGGTLPPATGPNLADGLLVELFGASQDTGQDSRLAAIAVHLLIGTAVYRAHHPGGKQDVTPVLISGWQGQGKSSLAAAVLPPGYRGQWFGDGLQLNMSRKEVAEVTAGKVIVEMPEMSGLRRAELATLKSWLTTSDDGQHRGAYAHTAESQPRRWSGIATCDKAEALPHDPAGHRRWLAVAIGPKTVNDMDAALEPMREQLWAHALKLYRDQAPKVPPALWQHVAEQNRQYEVPPAAEGQQTCIEGQHCSIEGQHCSTAPRLDRLDQL